MQISTSSYLGYIPETVRLTPNSFMVFQAYRGYGHFESINGNKKKSLDYLLKALEVMLNKIPEQDWDSEIFAMLYHAMI